MQIQRTPYSPAFKQGTSKYTHSYTSAPSNNSYFNEEFDNRVSRILDPQTADNVHIVWSIRNTEVGDIPRIYACVQQPAMSFPAHYYQIEMDDKNRTPLPGVCADKLAIVNKYFENHPESSNILVKNENEGMPYDPNNP